MLLIGLVGGTPGGREAVAAQVLERGGRRLEVLNLAPSMRPYTARERVVEMALVGLAADRQGSDGLLLTHVMTEAEALMIRQAGGVLWHVAGRISASVAIERADLLVTAREGGDRHWLDPIEALSETMLRQVLAA